MLPGWIRQVAIYLAMITTSGCLPMTMNLRAVTNPRVILEVSFQGAKITAYVAMRRSFRRRDRS